MNSFTLALVRSEVIRVLKEIRVSEVGSHVTLSNSNNAVSISRGLENWVMRMSFMPISEIVASLYSLGALSQQFGMPVPLSFLAIHQSGAECVKCSPRRRQNLGP
jgi:hypothetical protein